jgi:hypothetical protein
VCIHQGSKYQEHLAPDCKKHLTICSLH